MRLLESGGRLSGHLLEDAVEGGFAVEAAFEGDPQNREMLSSGVEQLPLDFFDAIRIDEFVKILTQFAVDSLGQLGGRAVELIGEFDQTKVGVEVGLMGIEEGIEAGG